VLWSKRVLLTKEKSAARGEEDEEVRKDERKGRALAVSFEFSEAKKKEGRRRPHVSP